MPGNDYAFHTRWSVPGRVAEVADVLFDPEDLVRWWPSVYMDVRRAAEGDERGIGSAFDLYTKGWLPYTLRWRMRVVSHDQGTTSTFTAEGDLSGEGVWRLSQDGDRVEVDFDWRVRADKPLLRLGSPVFKPVFSANHNWAMAKGLRSLELELARRSAASPAEREAVPPPPGRSASTPLLAGLAAAALLAFAFRRRRQT
ncbi:MULTISPECIES: SRPBCC family protein [unclassified Crossiella]|uniref:SRPBCC family protein n=1 Tax=unclassified Crossiella TaxID=2620835 RepID=UPI001FFE8354|nr:MULTISPECIES: SRPBCC family protein [unclassified Crossiella]MCK2236394.1 SRPBCC family protein [Crossiella sp. S99.2]MCK2250061.1 SRPBCC family protein [Crossiella sp. S99.1]